MARLKCTRVANRHLCDPRVKLGIEIATPRRPSHSPITPLISRTVLTGYVRSALLTVGTGPYVEQAVGHARFARAVTAVFGNRVVERVRRQVVQMSDDAIRHLERNHIKINTTHSDPYHYR